MVPDSVPSDRFREDFLSTNREQPGRLVLIGGHEDKKGERVILREVARQVGDRTLLIATLPSEVPGEVWYDYLKAFTEIGFRQVEHLEVARREDAYAPDRIAQVERAGGVFITGGDQLRITSKLGGTPLGAAIEALYRRGGLLAGTSAGASVMSEVMIVGGEGEQTPHVRGAMRMAPGLGVLPHLIVDQHFAQRGRLGRLLAALAHNPRLLAIGIDEDTAAVISDGHLEVMGSGAVTVVDGRNMHHSNLDDESNEDRVLSLFGVRLHLLCAGDVLELCTGEPIRGGSEATSGKPRTAEPAAGER
ncbi:MAG: cyanophycinase [Myxococcales bacterium]|nr:MAG: cyanophycinase [Myxococcales bacterium]